jgi:molybdenum cofactor biosynthesis enzyme MoaA
MASITDVFNQLTAINSRLDQLHTDLDHEISSTNAVKTSVDKVDATLNAGFANVSQGMQVLANLQHEANQVLRHISEQDDAIICILEHISQNTCEVLTQATVQTRLLRTIREDADTLKDIAETAHPEAVLERTRRLELEAEIERCCPPKPEPPACTYKPCPHPGPLHEGSADPKVPPFKPSGQPSDPPR